MPAASPTTAAPTYDGCSTLPALPETTPAAQGARGGVHFTAPPGAHRLATLAFSSAALAAAAAADAIDVFTVLRIDDPLSAAAVTADAWEVCGCGCVFVCMRDVTKSTLARTSFGLPA